MKHSKLVGAVSNCAVSTHHGTYVVRLKTAPTGGRKCIYFLYRKMQSSFMVKCSVICRDRSGDCLTPIYRGGFGTLALHEPTRNGGLTSFGLEGGKGRKKNSGAGPRGSRDRGCPAYRGSLLDDYHPFCGGIVPRPELVEINATCHRFPTLVATVPIRRLCSIRVVSRLLMS